MVKEEKEVIYLSADNTSSIWGERKELESLYIVSSETLSIVPNKEYIYICDSCFKQETIVDGGFAACRIEFTGYKTKEICRECVYKAYGVKAEKIETEIPPPPVPEEEETKKCDK